MKPTNTNEATDIIIDDGKKTYNIRNHEGEIIGQFRLNPTDMNIRKRYEEAIEKLDHLSDMIDENKTTDENFEMIEKFICDQMDYIFQSDVSGSFFSVVSPLSVMADGEDFFIKVLDAIGSVIQVSMKSAWDKADKKVSKYTKKYHA